MDPKNVHTIKDPWFFAAKAKRNYITPEDITASKRTGAARLTIYEAVLQAVEQGALEDASCCAFVALKSKGYK